VPPISEAEIEALEDPDLIEKYPPLLASFAVRAT